MNEKSSATPPGRDLLSCSLTSFAAAVHAAIRQIGTSEIERFGGRKVFISAVFRALARAGHIVGSLDEFKARLILAQRAGLISLARADLVAAMPRLAVQASEILSRGAELHFVIDPEAREPWEQDVSAEVA